MESLVEASSGAVGALVSTAILYPLDTCKTKYQAENRAHHQQKYRNISDVLWEAISTRQGLSLYQGLGTKNFQAFISQFIYFYGYSFLKRLYLRQTANKSIGTKANLIITATAAAGTVIVTQPVVGVEEWENHWVLDSHRLQVRVLDSHRLQANFHDRALFDCSAPPSTIQFLSSELSALSYLTRFFLWLENSSMSSGDQYPGIKYFHCMMAWRRRICIFHFTVQILLWI